MARHRRAWGMAAAMAVLAGCSGKPTVIAAMKYPATGATVVMHRENSLKVPAGYNEAEHIASWKGQQREQGYTVDGTMK